MGMLTAMVTLLFDSVIVQSISNPDQYGIDSTKGLVEQGWLNEVIVDNDCVANIDTLRIQQHMLALSMIYLCYAVKINLYCSMIRIL